MKKKKYKILYIFWLFLFLQSALEIDACGIKNTFFDSYDTYIAPSDSSAVTNLHPISLDVDFKAFSTCLYFSSDLLPRMLCDVFVCYPCPEKRNCVKPPSLNQLYDVWII
ncbi:hypothetical protein [Bacteroides sedimenti]|uniref:hypothetical protein n=1 Tax=Bacteroides sedimenti TaxID=2136147 RepID=UPI003342063E